MEKLTVDKIKKISYMIPVLVMAAFILTSCGKREIKAPTYDDTVDPADEVEYFAIVCNVDEVNGKIKLRSVGFSSELTLEYTGGADVRDKYGDIMSINDVSLGSIADVVYDANRKKLISLHISNSEVVEKKEGVSGAEIDYIEKSVKINGKSYRLSNNVGVFSDNKEIGLDEITSEDQLSVWIYNNIVCSFYVELGHGFVKLADYASYMGGTVEIGYDVIVPVTEDMLLTVREGTYTLRISKGEDSGTKEVTVERNQETTISLADIAIEPKQMGSILFHVTPSDAAVYIDKVRINPEGAVKLTYGKHRLDIVKEGYDTLSGTITVKDAYKVKEYTLVETGSTTESTTSKSSKTTESKTTENKTTSTESSTNSTTEATTESTSSSSDSSDVKDVTAATGVKTSNKVTVTAPDGASVYFDGEYIGIAPMSFTKVTGTHIITLSKTGYLSKSYTVTFADDGEDKRRTYSELVSLSSLIE